MENENIELPQNINSNYKDNQRIDKIKQEQREKWLEIYYDYY